MVSEPYLSKDLDLDNFLTSCLQFCQDKAFEGYNATIFAYGLLPIMTGFTVRCGFICLIRWLMLTLRSDRVWEDAHDALAQDES